MSTVTALILKGRGGIMEDTWKREYKLIFLWRGSSLHRFLLLKTRGDSSQPSWKLKWG